MSEFRRLMYHSLRLSKGPVSFLCFGETEWQCQFVPESDPHQAFTKTGRSGEEALRNCLRIMCARYSHDFDKLGPLPERWGDV